MDDIQREVFFCLSSGSFIPGLFDGHNRQFFKYYITWPIGCRTDDTTSIHYGIQRENRRCAWPAILYRTSETGPTYSAYMSRNIGRKSYACINSTMHPLSMIYAPSAQLPFAFTMVCRLGLQSWLTRIRRCEPGVGDSPTVGQPYSRSGPIILSRDSTGPHGREGAVRGLSEASLGRF